MTAPQVAPATNGEAERGTVAVADFSFWYGSHRALNDVTFSVAPRSVTALIGPSGCGKSTLLRSINRMNDVLPGIRHDGDITLDGRSVYEWGDAAGLRRRVGMVFQRPNPFPKSIYDNVAFGPRLNGLDGERKLDEIVEQALHRASLWDEVRDRLRHSALTLSGGQQQRLCIARALANEPEVLLLDEPASALDPISTQKVEDLLRELRTDITIMIVTHNLQQAARVSDRTAFFYLGELIEEGRTNDLFTSPRETRTEEYITGRFG